MVAPMERVQLLNLTTGLDLQLARVARWSIGFPFDGQDDPAWLGRLRGCGTVRRGRRP